MGHIKINGLQKSYLNRRRSQRSLDQDDLAYGERIFVLKDINLTISEGEMVCILGPSGCGKSTLLRIIAGFEEFSEGEVLWQ